jgi:hypothetical protein
MSRKCPDGVICFENTTIVVFLVITGIILYLAYMQFSKNSSGSGSASASASASASIYDTDPSRNGVYTYPPAYGAVGGNFLDLIPRYGGGGGGYTRGPADVLLNPYTPPLRDDRYIGGMGVNSIGLSGGMGGGMGGGVVIPINVPTRSVNSSYRQVGILTRVNGPETILSLMGRPLFPSQDKWQFYTMSDKNQSVKLPVTNKKRSCTSDMGCDNIYNGDTIYVEGYNDAFRATIYDNAIQYSIPYV